MKTRATALLTFFLVALPAFASAHQPRLVKDNVIEVPDPEVSKAYYAQPKGEQQTYHIVSDKEFDLYVSVVVPAIVGQKKDVSAWIVKDGDSDHPLAFLDAQTAEWKTFFEPFGHDNYFQGPEYKAKAPAGSYEVRVSSPSNDSRYSLAVGEIERFDLKETINAVRLIPGLKSSFFGKSPADFLLSPFGIGYVVAMFVLAFIVGFLYRVVVKRFVKVPPEQASKNLNKHDRAIRAVLGVVFLASAVLTTWNPVLLFLSGFSFYEAVFSWCAFYATLGKKTT